jgi:hypothetical protein
VIEHVAPAVRQDYLAHHRAWGDAVRVADVDVAGTSSPRERDLDVYVRVAWYRADDQDLHTTMLRQSWHDEGSAGWQLVDERRVDGDVGLLAEPIVFATPATPRPPARFPTVRIGD